LQRRHRTNKRERFTLARILHKGAAAGGRAMTQLAERTALNHLIETCTDAARGFRSAAAHVRDERLKAFFELVADERERFAAELLPQAQRLGGDAPADGTRAAALHRGWIDLKSRLTHDDREILAEAARGDDVTRHIFKNALEGMLPPEVREIVEEQYVAMCAEHEHIENFYPRVGL
jgi:uncharacterized protein (TIGR02284 family)